MKRVNLSDHARQYMGVPFRHQGRNPAVGIDCAGLVSLALKHANVPHTDVKGYGRQPDGETMYRHLESLEHLRRTPEPVAGGIVLFRIKHDPQHVAIWDGELLIHSYSTAGRVTSNPMDDWWRSRIVACYEAVL